MIKKYPHYFKMHNSTVSRRKIGQQEKHRCCKWGIIQVPEPPGCYEITKVLIYFDGWK